MIASMTGARAGPAGPRLLELIEASVTRLGAHRIRLGRRRRLSLPDDLDAVLVVISGRLAASLSAGDGRETFVADVGPGELIGENFALERSKTSLAVEVEEPGESYWFEASRFAALLESNGSFAAAAVREMCSRQSRMLQRLGEIATLPMPQRLAAELIRLALASPSGTVIAQMPTHEEIARRIATQREAVTKELSRLRRSGDIERDGAALVLAGSRWRRR